MKKEALFVALSNQKGGVGKSAFTVLLAGYLHYLKDKNVAVVDCDSPQHSLCRMRERDMQAIEQNPHYRQLLVRQWEHIRKKAYPVVGATPDKAREAADELARDGDFDIILVDLPGTMGTQGVFSTIVNMDYVITPIIADRIVMQSSLAFSTTVLDYIRGRSDIPLKDILFFWNRQDRRASTEIFDIYNGIIRQLGLTVLNTVVPETRRYDKELSIKGRSFFRCTLLPPPTGLLKGSGLAELAEEVIAKLKI
uniref:AAA family ATPase n=1 Tax=Prevotella sp. GTC17262 TaxID=3236797 RepID=A0AB33JNJ9_9BACT